MRLRRRGEGEEGEQMGVKSYMASDSPLLCL